MVIRPCRKNYCQAEMISEFSGASEPVPTFPYSMPHSRRHPPAPPAFTLIELLVVIGVVALLVGIMLPALAHARNAARQVREVAAGQQLIVAYHLYAEDHKGNLMVGYATSAMTDTATPENQSLIVAAPSGDRIYGVPARRYPWRIQPYFDGDFEGIYKDKALLDRYRERPDFQYVVSLSPSYGLNSMFLGGDADRFGFNPAALQTWGSFYITRLDQAQRSSSLVVFATSHGANPDGPEPVPGYFRIDPPFRNTRSWVSPAAPSDTNPAATGNVDFRHSGRAATARLDGHCDTLSPAELDNMLLWSDGAKSKDWHLESR